MKLAVLIAVMVIVPVSVFSQYPYLWGKVDTLTSGDFDDFNPSVYHGAFSYSYSSSTLWLIFERQSTTESIIAGRAFRAQSGKWDPGIVEISKTPAGLEQSRPDYSEFTINRLDSPYTSTFRIAAWQRRTNRVWNIFYSTLSDPDSVWGVPRQLTDDSVDNTSVQVRPLSYSPFILTWKRKGAILFALINSRGTSRVDTLAVSHADSLEYDIVSVLYSGALVWTDEDSTGKSFMVYRNIATYPSLSFSTPEPLTYPANVFSPRLILPGSQYVLFESDVADRRDIFLWQGSFALNISNDPLADDRNVRAFILPYITKGVANKPGAYDYFDAYVAEKYRSGDSSLIFQHSIYTDTLRSAGYNRNACLGTMRTIIPQIGPSLLVAWESNRSGRSHIYGRVIGGIFVDVSDKPHRPTLFHLSQNYPNPFNATTEIRFEIGDYGPASIRVYDILGRDIATLVNEPLKPGQYTTKWDASASPSGVYFYRLTSGQHTEARKLLLLR